MKTLYQLHLSHSSIFLRTSSTVARELLEETGLQVKVLDLIEVFDRIFTEPGDRDSPGNKKGPRFHFVIVDFLCQWISGEAKAGSDVTDVAYATENELANYQLTPTATRVLHAAFAMDRLRRTS